MELTRQIAAIALFEGLTPKQYEALASIVMDQTLKRGQMIFSEGDEGTGFFVVVFGRVKIFKLSAEGKEQILHIMGPGEPFGEVAVFSGKRFPANAQALTETRLFFFPRPAFMQLIGNDPSLASNMLAILSARLRRFAALVEDLSLKEVPGRLAAYLLSLSERRKGSAQIELDISKNQLAAILGTIPETLSRILARMVTQGLIKATGRRIQILDRQQLEELAGGSRRLG
jgi:CRP/FNR family transcriptional regulator, dissimilatory nitrate respiration regulator